MSFTEEMSTESGESTVAAAGLEARVEPAAVVGTPETEIAGTDPVVIETQSRSSLRMRSERRQSVTPIPPPEWVESYERHNPGSAATFLEIHKEEKAVQVEIMRHHMAMDVRQQKEREGEQLHRYQLQRNGQLGGATVVLAALGVVAFSFSLGAAPWGVALALLIVTALLGIWKSQAVDPMRGLTEFTREVKSISAKANRTKNLPPGDESDPAAIPEASGPANPTNGSEAE